MVGIFLLLRNGVVQASTIARLLNSSGSCAPGMVLFVAVILVLSLPAAVSRTGLAESPVLVKKKIEGNCELECVAGAMPWGFLLFFSADEKLSEYGYLKVSSSAIELGHHSKGKSVTWRRHEPPSPTASITRERVG
jgi:hypothetical protein